MLSHGQKRRPLETLSPITANLTQVCEAPQIASVENRKLTQIEPGDVLGSTLVEQGAALAHAGPFGGQVNVRVAGEEPVWLKRKAGRLARHHRKVLHPRNMHEPERVPQDHVFVDHAPVLARPRRQPAGLRATPALHCIVTGRPTLGVAVLSDPERLGSELAA